MYYLLFITRRYYFPSWNSFRKTQIVALVQNSYVSYIQLSVGRHFTRFPGSRIEYRLLQVWTLLSAWFFVNPGRCPCHSWGLVVSLYGDLFPFLWWIQLHLYSFLGSGSTDYRKYVILWNLTFSQHITKRKRIIKEYVLKKKAEIKFIKKAMFEKFHGRSDNYLHTLKFHLLDYIVEDLKIFETLTVLDASPF